MKKLIKIQNNRDKRSIIVTWVINNICSNKCSYCIPALYAGQNHNFDWNNAKRFIQRLINEYDQVHFNISGGEPTMSPFLPELAKLLHDSGNTIGITSNGIRTPKYWKSIAPYLDYVVFSYHPEYGDNNDLISKIQAIVFDTSVNVSVMMHPGYWEDAVNMYEKLYKLNYFYSSAVRLNDRNQEDKSTCVYSDEQLEWLKKADSNPKKYQHINVPKHGDFKMEYFLEDGTKEWNTPTSKFINEGQINFKGWTCHTGETDLYINVHGYIFGSNCTIDESYGHLDKPEEIVINKRPVICDGRRCDCGPDFKINKYKTPVNII